MKKWNKLFWSASLFIIVTTMLLNSCGGKKTAVPASAPKLGMEEHFEFHNPINYCLPANFTPIQSSVQVLIDASGSMTGYKSSAIQLSRWVKSAVSHMEGSTIQRKNFRLAHFNKRAGIFKSTPWTGTEPQLVAQYDTNLDDAFFEARGYDLTFIVTDGVAATGSAATSRCAGGVDASCVARVLAEIRQKSGDDSPSVQGIWLMPIVTTYDGTYYTEEPQGSFDPKETIAAVKSDVAVEVRLSNARPDKSGNLTFDYNGPRTLLLFVLSRNVEIGRAAVAALYQTALTTSVHQIKELKEYKSGIAIFEPLEVFPGYVFPVQWESLRKKDSKGNIGARLTQQGIHASITISGESGKLNSGLFTLQGKSTVQSSGAGCVPLHIMPSFRLLVQPTDPGRKDALSKIFRGFKKTEYDYLQLDMQLVADQTAGANCNSSPLETQLVALVDYKSAADAMASRNSTQDGTQLLKSLSTQHPKSEPHKVYNLGTIIQMFFQEVQNDQKRMTLSDISFCIN